MRFLKEKRSGSSKREAFVRERKKKRFGVQKKKCQRKRRKKKQKQKIVFTCAGDVRDRVEPRDEQPLLARAELDVDTEKGERVFAFLFESEVKKR